MKKYYVQDLQKSIGLSGESLFVLGKKEQRMTRSQKPYLDLLLRDRTGDIRAKVWSDHLASVKDVSEGDVVSVEFQVQEYNGNIDLVARKVVAVDEYDEEDMVQLPVGVDKESLLKELSRRVDSIRNFNLRELIDSFLDDEDFYQAYTTIPAASSIHHEYQHGLLQHTLEILTFCDGYIKMYPEMDRDLLITGALLHDIGKVRENNVDGLGSVQRTVEGNLVGHIAIGVEMVLERLPKDFPETLKHKVIHLILSHHGALEFGSPVVPATLEALALHNADKASMQLNLANKAIREGKAQRLDETTQFSDYIRYLGGRMYLGETEKNDEEPTD